jgi:hypothetical protein
LWLRSTGRGSLLALFRDEKGMRGSGLWSSLTAWQTLQRLSINSWPAFRLITSADKVWEFVVHVNMLVSASSSACVHRQLRQNHVARAIDWQPVQCMRGGLGLASAPSMQQHAACSAHMPVQAAVLPCSHARRAYRIVAQASSGASTSGSKHVVIVSDAWNACCITLDAMGA